MPDAADTAFIAETRSLAALEPDVERFFADLVRRVQAHRPTWHWVGIYLLVGDTLRLGPYVGAATEHVAIPVGVGVCGTAVASDTNIIVDDVRARDNYLACSLETRSELVVLIRDQGEVLGQFDVDSDNVAEFGERDTAFLQSLAAATAPHARALRDALARKPQAAPA
ncbi:MAG TPA: GAF domain-containing protein [Chloroflexota bacterium]|jgi:GAF domain-containing protein